MLATQTEKQLRTWSWLLHLIGLAITVLGFMVFCLCVLRPIDQHLVDIAGQAASMERLLDMEHLVTEEHATLSEELSRADENILLLMARIPSGPSEADFLGQITTLAHEVDLEIVDFRPGKIVEQDEYLEMSVALTSVGSYAGICRFLHRMNQIPRLSRAMRLDISPRNDGETYSMAMNLTIFFAPQSSLAVASAGVHNE